MLEAMRRASRRSSKCRGLCRVLKATLAGEDRQDPVDNVREALRDAGEMLNEIVVGGEIRRGKREGGRPADVDDVVTARIRCMQKLESEYEEILLLNLKIEACSRKVIEDWNPDRFDRLRRNSMASKTNPRLLPS